MSAKKSSPKSIVLQTADLALAASQEHANSYSIVPHTVVRPAPRAAGAPVYELGDKAPRDCQTKQGAKSGLGKNWHTVARTGLNTRQQCYNALCELEDQFTEAEALAALKPIVAGTSGTPRSYWAAFVAAGYIQEA